MIAKSLAPSGFVFNIIALVTGSIWGKPTWGHGGLGCKNNFNVNFSFILWNVLLSWRIYENKEQVYKITNHHNYFSVINLPIIKYSVDWWNTLHQPASINI